MKELLNTLIKILISAIILTIAFFYFEKKPEVPTVDFNVIKKETTSSAPTPSSLKWHDSFKGIENLPPKPKVENTENKK